jgi:hypothetical protein
MNTFEDRLTFMLDEVASSVHPHSDPDGIFTPTVSVVPTKVKVLKPRYIAVAAAGIFFVGGSAFAMERINSDSPSKVVPAAAPVTEPTHEPTTTTLAPAVTIAPTVEITLPAESPHKPVIVPVPPTEPTVLPTEPTVPPTEPTVAPAVIEFTARLGADGRAKNPMTQGFSGNAQPGSAIHVESAYGVADTTANANGKWETKLTMVEVPPGTNVGVRITSSTSDRVREFSLLRPDVAPPTTVAIEFTAFLGTNGQANTPMTQMFYGNAQPGSAIRVGCDWGVAETVTGPNGIWQTTLTMGDVPPGTTIGVRITSNTSTRVREFTLQRPGTPAPTSIDFNAKAAWATTDHTPPFDEYSGTSTAGAVISLSSPYGSSRSRRTSKAAGRLESNSPMRRLARRSTST